jgi:hypothetical protein
MDALVKGEGRRGKLKAPPRIGALALDFAG